MELRETDRQRIQQLGRPSVNALQLHDVLFTQPIVTVQGVEEHLGASNPTANSLVAALEKMGMLKETTGQKRTREYRYAEYLQLLEERDQRE